ncbi:MAG: hypothetical protein QM753_00845 [Thermomicrobiales bacterium]
MTTTSELNRADLFVRYESALASLSHVPGQLENDLTEAQAAFDVAISNAAASVVEDEQRLNRLRQTITTRFNASAQSLRDANVLVPLSVRASGGRKGDPSSLTEAINTQHNAEKAVANELQAAASAAKRQAANNTSQIAASQNAAEALRKRQERIRHARDTAPTGDERERVRSGWSLKQHRQLIVVGSTGFLIIIVILATQLF